MKVRGRLLRLFPARREPKWVEEFGYFRTYPAGYEIAGLGTFAEGSEESRSTGEVTLSAETTGSTRDLLGVAALFGQRADGRHPGGHAAGQQVRLDLGRNEISGLLLTAALFTVLSMNLSGPVADRVGARMPTLVEDVVMLVASVLMGAAPSYPVLVLGAAVFGVGNGAMDCA